MNDSQNFEQLQRLLKLKRYEQPPPGFFNRFPGEVLSRIRAGEAQSADVFTRLFDEAPWLQRFWRTFETNPLLGGAFGAAVCALMISGILYSGNIDQPSSGAPMASGLGTAFASATPTVFVRAEETQLISSTNPIVPQGNSFLSQFGASVEQVSFTPR